MAEGGDFGNENPDLDNKLDNDDEQEVDTTRPFQPGAASTPYHLGEQIELKTRQREQSGLSNTSYDETADVETPLFSDFSTPEERQGKVNWALDFIKKRFPNVDLKKLGPIGFSKKGAQTDIVSFGPKGGESKIFKKDGSGLLKSFTDKFSNSLRPSAEEILVEDHDTIKEQRQRLVESERQLKESQKIGAEKKKKSKKLKN